jgi:hypothetical protein
MKITAPFQIERIQLAAKERAALSNVVALLERLRSVAPEDSWPHLEAAKAQAIIEDLLTETLYV